VKWLMSTMPHATIQEKNSLKACLLIILRRRIV